MTAHVVDLRTAIALDAAGVPTGGFRYRWRCSCGEQGRWHATDKQSGSGDRAARRARNGGARHVAAMERGR